MEWDFNAGELAHYDLKKLDKLFGVMGNERDYHAWLFYCEWGARIMDGELSFGKGQVLMRDYKEVEEMKYVEFRNVL